MSLQRLLLVPDTHAPYHDKRAWALMIRAATDFKPDLLVCIGDFIDCYSVSSHSKSPTRARRLPEEIASALALLDQLDGLEASRKIYVEGNHEDRLRRYINDEAPELFGLIDIPRLLRLPSRGWEFVRYRDDVRIGKVYFTHDVGTSGRYATYKALDTYQHSVVIGHLHRIQYAVEGNAVGEFKLAAQFGWLGDRSKIDYMQKARVHKETALGFGIGYVDPKSGYVYLVPVPIVNYTCCVEGELYK